MYLYYLKCFFSAQDLVLSVPTHLIFHKGHSLPFMVSCHDRWFVYILGLSIASIICLCGHLYRSHASEALNFSYTFGDITLLSGHRLKTVVIQMPLCYQVYNVLRLCCFRFALFYLASPIITYIYGTSCLILLKVPCHLQRIDLDL